MDYPADGPCPGSSQCELLGLFAAQAGIAVDKARLREELQLQHDRLKVSEKPSDWFSTTQAWEWG